MAPGNKLKADVIEAMYLAFQEKQSVNYVAKKIHIAPATVRRYRKMNKWDERIRSIEAKAHKKADLQTSNKLAAELKLLTAAKQSYAAQLLGEMQVICPHCLQQHKVTVPKLKAMFRDIDTILRLSEFMQGEADSREQLVIVHKYPEDIIDG